MSYFQIEPNPPNEYSGPALI